MFFGARFCRFRRRLAQSFVYERADSATQYARKHRYERVYRNRVHGNTARINKRDKQTYKPEYAARDRAEFHAVNLSADEDGNKSQRKTYRQPEFLYDFRKSLQHDDKGKRYPKRRDFFVFLVIFNVVHKRYYTNIFKNEKQKRLYFIQTSMWSSTKTLSASRFWDCRRFRRACRIRRLHRPP